jgi:NADH-quinone oxidoreductase subunit M
MFQKVFFGPLDKAKNGHLPDLSVREKVVFLPLVVLIFVLGFFPRPFLAKMEPSVKAFLADYHEKLAEPDGPARMMSAEGSPDAIKAKLEGAAAKLDAAARLGGNAGGQP